METFVYMNTYEFLRIKAHLCFQKRPADEKLVEPEFFSNFEFLFIGLSSWFRFDFFPTGQFQICLLWDASDISKISMHCRSQAFSIWAASQPNNNIKFVPTIREICFRLFFITIQHLIKYKYPMFFSLFLFYHISFFFLREMCSLQTMTIGDKPKTNPTKKKC